MYPLMTNMQARSMAPASSKLLALLFKANMVSQALLHKCLQHQLAQPSNVRAEAAAYVLYLIEPFMSQHYELTAAADMDVYCLKLRHLCTGGSICVTKSDVITSRRKVKPGMACISMIQEEIQQDSDLKLWAEHPLVVNRHR